MEIVPDSLVDQITVDFAHACAELAHARLLQQLRDTSGHRAAVATWQARIDLVLDMFLESADGALGGTRG